MREVDFRDHATYRASSHLDSGEIKENSPASVAKTLKEIELQDDAESGSALMVELQ
ncbi:hypothetical protein K5D44_00110 [Pseudomonas cichorii]|nr:hypothetical protein [Pseudomonas cichorii]MBX8563101.1 hypothetical protein [Pseudomonas cichorii]